MATLNPTGRYLPTSPTQPGWSNSVQTRARPVRAAMMLRYSDGFGCAALHRCLVSFRLWSSGCLVAWLLGSGRHRRAAARLRSKARPCEVRGRCRGAQSTVQPAAWPPDCSDCLDWRAAGACGSSAAARWCGEPGETFYGRRADAVAACSDRPATRSHSACGTTNNTQRNDGRSSRNLSPKAVISQLRRAPVRCLLFQGSSPQRQLSYDASAVER